MQRIITLGIAVIVMAIAAGCQTAPQTPERRAALEEESSATLRAMAARDPSVDSVVQNAYGYAIFPSVGEAGAVAGAAYGRGVAYERGQPVGFVELNQGSLGLQLGGQTFSQLIVFENQQAFDRLREGTFTVAGDASATVLNAGVAGQTQFRNGIAVFIHPRGGLMGDVSLAGQTINFEPMDGARTAGERMDDAERRDRPEDPANREGQMPPDDPSQPPAGDGGAEG